MRRSSRSRRNSARAPTSRSTCPRGSRCRRSATSPRRSRSSSRTRSATATPSAHVSRSRPPNFRASRGPRSSSPTTGRGFPNRAVGTHRRGDAAGARERARSLVRQLDRQRRRWILRYQLRIGRRDTDRDGAPDAGRRVSRPNDRCHSTSRTSSPTATRRPRRPGVRPLYPRGRGPARQMGRVASSSVPRRRRATARRSRRDEQHVEPLDIRGVEREHERVVVGDRPPEHQPRPCSSVERATSTSLARSWLTVVGRA